MDSANSQTVRPLSPAAILSHWIDSNGLSQKAAARELQWKEPELSMILANRRPISERMARDLARTLADLPDYAGWTPDDWLACQKTFQEWARTSQGAAETWRARSDRFGILSDIDISEAVSAGALKIDPFRDSSIQPASYDLTVSVLTWFNRRNKYGERHRVEILEDRWATLAPGETVHVLARETLHIPVNMTGRLAPVGHLVERGVLCSFGIQLDPGWDGPPFFVLSHQGSEEIDIGFHDPCVSVEFHFLQRPPQNPFGRSPRPERFTGRKDR
jgi:deoxycytidine triphosphate deaminase/plasmid maintenance system antidote protein VapI